MIATFALALFGASLRSISDAGPFADFTNGPYTTSCSVLSFPTESVGYLLRDGSDGVLAKVRAAVHYGLRPPAGCLMTGTARLVGTDEPFSLQFDGAGKWIEKIGSPASTRAYDGTNCWSADETGATVVESHGTATEDRFLACLLTDGWLSESSGVSVKEDAVQDRQGLLALDVGLDGAQGTARIWISKVTFLPTQAALPGMFAEQTAEIRSWTQDGTLSVPASIEVGEPGDKDTYTVTQVRPVTDYAAGAYKVPAWEPSDTTFDASASSAVETIRCDDGHILVHPLVGGRDVGWFMVDSGAGSMCVDTAVAKELDLKALRSTRVYGIAGKAAGTRSRMPSFSIGPLSIRDLPCDTMDLSAAATALGRPIAGIVGYDVFRRAVVQIPHDGEVRLRKPDGHLAGATPLVFEGGAPAVRLECERGAGSFMIDTGSNAPVVFFSPFVQTARLLEGRDTSERDATGVGGRVTFRVGKIGWLKFCGVRVKDRTAAFATGDQGVFANKYLAGSVGQGILRMCDVTFDYGHGEIVVQPAEGQTCFGDDLPGRTITTPGEGWISLATDKTFYERHLDPGESVAFEVLEPEKVYGTSYPGDCRCSIETSKSPKGVRVVFVRDRRKPAAGF